MGSYILIQLGENDIMLAKTHQSLSNRINLEALYVCKHKFQAASPFRS